MGAGLRRIEAVTGRGAQQLAQMRLAVLDDAAAFLGRGADEIDRKVLDLMEQVQALKKQLRRRSVKRRSATSMRC